MATVLVIEDDRDLYSLFDLILKMAGFEVNVVSNGTEAIRERFLSSRISLKNDQIQANLPD